MSECGWHSVRFQLHERRLLKNDVNGAAANPNRRRSKEDGSGTAVTWLSVSGTVSPVRMKLGNGLSSPLSVSEGRPELSGVSLSGGVVFVSASVFVSVLVSLLVFVLDVVRITPPVVSPPLGRSTARLSMAKDFFLPMNSKV